MRNVTLTPATLHVLVALTDGEKYGYEIFKGITQCTNGKMKPSTGTVYDIIKRLCDSKMIEMLERPKDRLEYKRRRYYRLTNRGREAVIAEVARIKKTVELAHGC